MKYMVMECHPAYAVVLGDDGQFRKVANLRYQVGQTVDNIVEMALPAPTKKRSYRWVPALTAVAACMVLLLGGWFLNFRAYASVYITINPEVRIDVSRRDTVVGVEGMNEDGIALLAGYDYRNKSLDTVTEELVDLAIAMGYLHEGGKVTLTLDAEENWVVEHEEALNNRLQTHLTDRLQVTVDIDHRDYPGHPGDSDYGDSSYEDVTQPVDSHYGEPQATDTPYGDSGYSDSDYGTDEEDKEEGEEEDTPYGSTEPTDGDSGYGSDSDHGSTESEDSPYDATEPEEGETPYDSASSYGSTDYV